MNIQCRSKRRTGARRPRRPTTGGRTVSARRPTTGGRTVSARRPTTGGRTVSARRPTTGGRTVSARRPLRTNSFSRHRSVPRMHRPRAPSTVGGGQCVFLQILVHKSYRPPVLMSDVLGSLLGKSLRYSLHWPSSLSIPRKLLKPAAEAEADAGAAAAAKFTAAECEVIFKHLQNLKVVGMKADDSTNKVWFNLGRDLVQNVTAGDLSPVTVKNLLTATTNKFFISYYSSSDKQRHIVRSGKTLFNCRRWCLDGYHAASPGQIIIFEIKKSARNVGYVPYTADTVKIPLGALDEQQRYIDKQPFSVAKLVRTGATSVEMMARHIVKAVDESQSQNAMVCRCRVSDEKVKCDIRHYDRSGTVDNGCNVIFNLGTALLAENYVKQLHEVVFGDQTAEQVTEDRELLDRLHKKTYNVDQVKPETVEIVAGGKTHTVTVSSEIKEYVECFVHLAKYMTTGNQQQQQHGENDTARIFIRILSGDECTGVESSFDLNEFIVTLMRYDTDGDGKINAAEFQDAFDTDLFASTGSEQTADQVFKEIDADNSGHIEIDEIKRWWWMKQNEKYLTSQKTLPSTTMTTTTTVGDAFNILTSPVPVKKACVIASTDEYATVVFQVKQMVVGRHGMTGGGGGGRCPVDGCEQWCVVGGDYCATHTQSTQVSYAEYSVRMDRDYGGHSTLKIFTSANRAVVDERDEYRIQVAE